MSETKKIKVNEVKERPAELKGYSMVMRGIRTKEAAETWGAKYGFPVVYWIKAEEKVYGVKDIAQSAQALEQKSVQLLQQVEVQS
jgi:hypothetical protein